MKVCSDQEIKPDLCFAENALCKSDLMKCFTHFQNHEYFSEEILHLVWYSQVYSALYTHIFCGHVFYLLTFAGRGTFFATVD